MAKIDVEIPQALPQRVGAAESGLPPEPPILAVHGVVLSGDDARHQTGKATPVLRIPCRPTLLLDRAFLLEILRIMEREAL